MVPSVSVDGTIHYNSVTLKLDMTMDTFTVLDAMPKNTSFSETALETLLSNGLKVDFMGCARSGHNQISCKTKVVSTTKNQRLVLNGTASTLFDDLGGQRHLAVFDQKNSFASVNLIQGVPVEVMFIFKDIDSGNSYQRL